MSASAAAKNFGALVDRVRNEQAVYVIERGGTSVARIGPVERPGRVTMADLAALLQAGPRPDAAFLSGVEQGIHHLNKPEVSRDPWAS